MTEDAMLVLDEWLLWLFGGNLPENSILLDARKELTELSG
jgi:hypothetical protein